MASNRNSPQKGSGANQPDKKQSVETDAASVDWMIMSDLSTRIGGVSQPKSNSKQEPNVPAVPLSESDNQFMDDDLEDLEWLRSLNLDDPIERSPAPKSTSSHQNSNDVENIDWLIVTNLKTRIDDSEIRAKDNLKYPEQSLNPTPIPDYSAQSAQLIDQELNGDDLDLDDLDLDDLGLNKLEFSSSPDEFDFSGLDSLGFDISDNSDDLNANEFSNELSNEIDITEGKISELAEFLDNDRNLNDTINEDDWDLDSKALENIGDQFSEPHIFDVINESYEIPTEISGFIIINDQSHEDLILESAQPSESNYQEDLSKDWQDNSNNNSNNNWELSDEINSNELIEDFSASSVDNEFEDEFQDAENIFIGEEIGNLSEKLVKEIDNQLNNELNNEFGKIQPLGLVESDVIGDEIWSSQPLASEVTNQSNDDPFASDWEHVSTSVNTLDDAIWDSNPHDGEAIAATSIDNAFGSLDDWAIAPQSEQLESEQLELEQKSDFDLVSEENIKIEKTIEAELSNATPQIFEQEELKQDFLLNDEPSLAIAAHPDVDLEQSIDLEQSYEISDQISEDEDWSAGLEAEIAMHNDADLGNKNSDDWNVDQIDQFEANVTDRDAADLESMLDENFDLASFDTDTLSEAPSADFNNINIATTLTPIRRSSPAQDNVSSPPENLSTTPATGRLDTPPPKIASFSPVAPLPSSSSFGTANSDRDFLDDFDIDGFDLDNFDNIDVSIAEDDFNSGFTLSTGLSTGLNPTGSSPIASPPPIAPPLPPVTKIEPTAPNFNNPPPPPFLPPLPPKWNPAKPTSAPTPSPSNKFQSQGEDDFDSFHAQQDQIQQDRKKNRKSINAIDESWSELLDAETVLSEVSRSPIEQPFTDSKQSSRSNISESAEARAAANAARASQGRLPNTTAKNAPKTSKGSNLHDFNDLGLEIHDDNADWSGLLDSVDMSDNITTISNQGSPISARPSHHQGRASRSEQSDKKQSDTSETREIPSNRRKPMANFGDATQARMSAPPDQIDFNRFTEDSYGAYDSNPPQPIAPPTKSKPKITIPSISLESLWQDYLKIPVIGLGAIGGAFLLYSLLNRPVFDLGLRWGLFKDASGKDFTNADFKGAKLDNADFSKSILTGAKMQDASLVGANFQGANLDGVNFTKANLNNARLIKASVIWAEFNNAQMNLVDFAEADLTRSNFANAKMEGANLKSAKIGAQGTEKATIFSSTTLLAWQIVNEPKEGRNLAEQNLSGLNLSFTSLKRANLSNSKLNYTDMTGTDLRGANLTGGQINGANWSGAKLNDINLTDVVFDKTKLPKTDEETICPNGKKGPCKFQSSF